MEKKVLILHGWEDDSSRGFIPELVKTLKDKGYSPKSIDLPNTKKPKFEEWFDSAENEIAEDEQISIIGHSMGGLLALKLSEKYKVDKLVLVAPVGANPSDDYYKTTTSDLNEEEREIFKKFANRNIDEKKIKENSNEIDFIFGKKDPYINEEIRNSYSEKFKDKAKIQILDNQAHMAESDGVKKLPVVEDIFEKLDAKSEEKNPEEKKDAKKPETKKDEKKEVKKKKDEKPKVKKEFAFARGKDIHISKKHGMYICSFIKNKKIDEAISDLEQVKKYKKIVPFKGEIPHRKGKGMMSGRYPVKAAGLFITLLKGLKGNVLVNGLELEKSEIYFASASWAKRPARRANRQGKRTNVLLKAKEIQFKGGKK